MNDVKQVEQNEITAKVVSNGARIHALPKHFKNHFAMYENTIYRHADMLINGYNGGYWDFIELSNGGFYMKPNLDSDLISMSFPNYYEDEIEADVAGVIISLYTYSVLHPYVDGDLMAKHYHNLLDYIDKFDDEKYCQIKRAID